MSTNEKSIYGHCAPEFELVEKVFRKNFQSGWEREGAAVSVYHKGRQVVNLKGGWADKEAGRRWDDETRTVVFSVSKAVSALAVAMCVDRGYTRYEQKVVEFWPEFGQYGKEEITVDLIMSHRAGLAAFDMPITLEAATDHKVMSRIIEEQQPLWSPGTKCGYHAVTLGWLVDQIVRRVDPQKRSLAQFVRDEITKPHDLDFHLGLPVEEQHTVSRLTLPSHSYTMKELLYEPRLVVLLGTFYSKLGLRNSFASRVVNNPKWMVLRQPCTFNNPQLHRIEQGAALGISRAADLAKLFSLMLEGKFLSRELLELFTTPQVGSDIFDCVVGLPFPKGHGFAYERHPLKPGKWLYGHPGFGGTTLIMDPEEELVLAYVSNGLKNGSGVLTGTYRRLRNAALASCVKLN